MKNKIFNQAVWQVRKDKMKKHPSKSDLIEAAKLYFEAGNNKKKLALLLKEVYEKTEQKNIKK